MYLAHLHLTPDILAEKNHISKIFHFMDVTFGYLRQSLSDIISVISSHRFKICTSKMQAIKSDMMERELTAGYEDEETGYFKNMKITFTARRGQPEQRQRFAEVKEELLNNLVANIEAQFPQIDLLTLCKFLNLHLIPMRNTTFYLGEIKTWKHY